MIIVLMYGGLVEGVIGVDDWQSVDLGDIERNRCPVCGKIICDMKFCHECNIDWKAPTDQSVVEALKRRNYEDPGNV